MEKSTSHTLTPHLTSHTHTTPNQSLLTPHLTSHPHTSPVTHTPHLTSHTHTPHLTSHTPHLTSHPHTTPNQSLLTPHLTSHTHTPHLTSHTHTPHLTSPSHTPLTEQVGCTLEQEPSRSAGQGLVTPSAAPPPTGAATPPSHPWRHALSLTTPSGRHSEQHTYSLLISSFTTFLVPTPL